MLRDNVPLGIITFRAAQCGLFEMAVILRFWWFKNIEKKLTSVHARVIPVLVVGPLAATSVRRCARSQAGLLCGRAAVAAGRSPLAVRRPFLTSKQAAAQKIKRLRRALPWSTPCGAGWNGGKSFLWVYQVRKRRVRIQEFYFCSRTLDDRFVCVPILRVRLCTVGCASRGGCAAVLSCRSGAAVVDGRRAASCRCARCFDRFLLTRAPVPKIFGACGGHRARSLALQNTGQIMARPGQRSLR